MAICRNSTTDPRSFGIISHHHTRRDAMKKARRHSRRDFLAKAPAALASAALASLAAARLPLPGRSRKAPRLPEGSIYTPADKRSQI